MQCPLMKYSCCFLSLKGFLLLVGFLGVALGIFSVIAPRRSITLYQRIMERINWKVAPLDESKEVKNTVFLGHLLVVLSIVLGLAAWLKY